VGLWHDGRLHRILIVFALGLGIATAQDPPTRGAPGPETAAEAASTTATDTEPAAEGAAASALEDRTRLNLLGQTDADSGESRRNENVQFNLIDNNALKELNVRLGVSATVVQEFDSEREYFGAEFGNAPSASLHVDLPQTSGVHGRLFAKHQNSVFTARSFFQVGEVQPSRENDYGLALTTGIAKNIDLTLSAGQQRVRGNVNGNVLVPKSDERTALATDPATRALVQQVLAAYPNEAPNRTDINERALNTNAPQSIDSDNAALRLGVRDGDNRYVLDYGFTSQQVDAFQLVAGQNPDTSTRSHRARATWSRTLSASTVIDASVGFDRVGSLLTPEENAVGPLIVTSNALTGLGPGGAIPIDRAENLFRQGVRVSSIRGDHTLTVGFEGLRRQFNGVESDVHRGFFSFGANFGRSAIENLRLGLPTQQLLSVGNVSRGFRQWDLQFYFGDEWRPSSRLQIQLGLRYGIITTPEEVNGFNNVPYDCDCNNVAPQFGYSYRLSDHWGVLRGGYGLHYGRIFPVTYQQIRFSPPVNVKSAIVDPSFTDFTGGFDPNDPNIVPVLYRLDPELATPYSHQYNLSWQLEPAPGWSLELGYVGSRSHKLLLMYFGNRAQPREGLPLTTGTVNARREDPSFATIRTVRNGSDGYYDAARVSLRVPSWRGLSVDASYWFSKAIDRGSSYTNTAYDADARLARGQYEFDFSDMRGLSDFDQPHALLARIAYQTPSPSGAPRWFRHALGGWTTTGILLLKNGTPFTLLAGSDAPGFGNVDGIGNDRPNVLDPSILGRTVGDPDTSREKLDRRAFGFIAPTDPFGNLGRNTFRKGKIANVNASIAKDWPIGSDWRLGFRAESINLLNTPQFAEPGLSVANPNFGQITNTLNDGRTFLFGLDLQF